MENKKSVSIVLPVYNEKEIIEDVIYSLYNNIYTKLEDGEFIVAEDGSTDGTKEVLEKLTRKLPIKFISTNQRKGYARAVKDALSLATKDIVFFTDSDGQHKEADFWKLLPFIGDFDIVTGYKCPRIDTAFRLFISRIMNALIYLMFGCFFRDINSGFKLYRRQTLKILLDNYEGLDFISTELLIKAYLMKMDVAEVPVLHYKRKFGSSRGLPTAQLPGKILGLLWGLFRIKLRLLFKGKI